MRRAGLFFAFVSMISLQVLQAADQASPPNSLTVDSSGNVGMGTDTPSTQLHVVKDAGANITVENTSLVNAERTPFSLINNGKTRFAIKSGPHTWTFDNDGLGFSVSKLGTGMNELRLNSAGNLTILGNLTEGSSINSKTGFREIDTAKILDKVVDLPITEWSYRKSEDIRHIGPMAEDFASAFGLGGDEHGIAPLDVNGISLASIQALYEKLQVYEQQLHQQQQEIEQLRQNQLLYLNRAHEFQARLSRLEIKQVKTDNAGLTAFSVMLDAGQRIVD